MITIQVPDKFALTVEQVAKLLNVTEKTVRNKGALPTTDPEHLKIFEVGALKRIEVKELVNYIYRNYTNPDIQYIS